MSHRLTLLCDSCGKEWMVEEDMDIPPYWFGVQISIADKEGLVPQHEREVYTHFCGQECFKEYVSGDSMRERAALIDKQDTSDGFPNGDEGE